ncbi:hypothetical protein M378DRAFT_166095 [Amanita muscaria Koide BX008]|uniref:NACHT domain-containing protein n=1 Tax=Amanita muscaria (strain Koide BX008) TaxID=946122 RepID=A0A0C2WKP0_AMAMK|nr:hypothetical protein M378DRAFT_166095 [Amanita muscaria Koide BX008]
MPIVEAKNVKIGGHAILYEVHDGDAVIFQFGDGRYSEAERDVIRDHISNASAFKLPDIDDIIRKHSLNQSIITLPRPQAAYGDYQNKKKIGPCFKGTREALLQEMADWVSGTDETRMYVLSGLAGIGKSTVAYTIAARADELGLLGASFFFSRDESDRKNAKMFFTAIAYQLCLYSETFSQAIGNALLTKRGSAATTKDPEEQLEALILVPLRNVVQSRVRPILIVVDALDECDEEDGRTVLKMLTQLVRDLPSFNVILTTRPQSHFDHLLCSQGGHRIFRLQDIEDKVVDSDIRLYLQHSLSLEQVRERLQDPEEDWYASEMQIGALVRVSGKLFIIASTAVRYILDRFVSDPAAQMQQLLHASSHGRAPFKDLSHFYTIILRNAVPANCDDAALVERYQAVVGTLMLIQTPLPVAALADLLKVGVKQIRIVVRKLQSVIWLGSDDIPHIYHKSFPDYISDSKHCQDVNLRIEPKIRHTQIATRCFQIMEQHLKYNILGLGYMARFMDNQDGFAKDGIKDEQLQERIPLQLRYACIHWVNHLELANIEDPDLMKELEVFADRRMLHWLEALSLVGELNAAHRAICRVLKFLKPTSSDLHQFLSDGLRFISKFYDTIKRSALHTYYSALLFAPTECLLYRRYIKGGLPIICDVISGLDEWDAVVAYSNHGGWVDNVQFSLDNAMFASRSKESDGIKGVLKVWDGTSGTPISTIRGSGFAIANNFSTVASFKDDIITLYNVDGTEQGASFTTQVEIFQVAISSESSRIAAILSDGTVCLWDSQNGRLVGSYKNNLYGLGCPQFSATGARLAYSSANGIVKLRDGIDGRLVADLDCGSEHVAFSRDGSRIASLRTNGGLSLWSCEDGGLVGTAKTDGCHPLAISTDGSLLAIGVLEEFPHKVELWSGNNDLLPLFGIPDLYPLSVAFAPDDTLAITTQYGMNIYNVKSRSFISSFPFIGWTGSPMAFSPNSSRLAAGNSDGRVYLWDLGGIEASSPSSNKQTSNRRLTALALSPNCSRVACGFDNGTIELWETYRLEKQWVATERHSAAVTTLAFSPDGEQFASGSSEGTINMWIGEDGTLYGALPYQLGLLYGVEVSNSVLVAVVENGISLWDRKTLTRIYTLKGSYEMPLSFSANGALLVAAARDTAPTAPTEIHFSHRAAVSDSTTPQRIIVFDVTGRRTIATFDVSGRSIHAMAFLPDNLHLVVHLYTDDHSDSFLTFNLVNQVMQETTIEHLIQLPNMPLWHGVPVWVNMECGQLRALFSQHDDPVPVLWISRELNVNKWAKGRSMIALGCEDGRIILLRPGSNPRG